MENNEVEQEGLYEDKNDYSITEEKLEHINPDLNHNFPYPIMNSGIMSIHHNNPEKFIDEPKVFCQCRSWLLSGHKGNTRHPTTIKSSTAQLYVGSNSYVFTKITKFAYIRLVKHNEQIINDRKSPARVFGLVIIKNNKNKHNYTTMDIILYAKNPQNKISQTAIKHYN